jgi:hypothetical protein
LWSLWGGWSEDVAQLGEHGVDGLARMDEGFGEVRFVGDDMGDFFDGGGRAVVRRRFWHGNFGGGKLDCVGYSVSSCCGDKNGVVAVVVHGRADVPAFAAMVTEGVALMGPFVYYGLGAEGCQWRFMVVEAAEELGVG